MFRTLMCFCVLVALVALTGCGEGGPPAPSTVKAGGTVTLDGQPVDGALVSFAPVSGGQAATGMTDSKGEFKLMTGGKYDGAVAGKYNVGVTKAAEGPKMSMEEYYAKQQQRKDKTGGPEQPKSTFPATYADPAKSGLSFEVKAGDPNQFKIELKK